jgi:hypothetical protein
MAQLDQLIDAMLSHRAEALLLRTGSKPCLLLDGAERTIVKTPLNAAQVSRLTAEIAPSEHRSTVAGGRAASFTYDRGGQTVVSSPRRRPSPLLHPQHAHPSHLPRLPRWWRPHPPPTWTDLPRPSPRL